MRAQLRRTSAELRLLASGPVVAAALALTALAVWEQHDAASPAVAPSLINRAGAVWIAALWNSTLAGFVIAGAVAATTLASRLGNGSIDLELLVEPRPRRFLADKALAALIVSTAAAFVTAIALVIASYVAPPLDGVGVEHPRWAQVVGPATAALLVQLMLIAVAQVVALVSRSALITMLVMVVLAEFPSSIALRPVGWTTPSRWVTEVFHLDPLGDGTDFQGPARSLNTHWSPAGPTAIAVMAVVIVAWMTICPQVLRWAHDRPSSPTR